MTEATRQGHHLALLIAILAAAAVAASFLFTLSSRRFTPSRSWRLAFAGAVVVGAAVAAGAAVHRYGDPVTIARHGYSSFKSPPASTRAGTSLNTRLLSLSSNGRIDLWHVAWRDARAHPVAGSGAGSYQVEWERARPTPLTVRDGHSLYLETLAELGPVGLVLLAVALAAPFLGLSRARTHPLGSAAVAAYSTYLLHAAADWDWEMPAVTTAGLLCGGAILVCSRRGARPPFGNRARLALAAAAAPLLVLSFVGLVGNRALADAKRAAAAHEWKQSQSRARAAVRWAPWSSDALDVLGNAEYARGERARAYRTLLKAARKDPNNWSVWYDVGDAAPTRRLSLAAYRRAAALNPLSPNIAMLRRLHILPSKSAGSG